MSRATIDQSIRNNTAADKLENSIDVDASGKATANDDWLTRILPDQYSIQAVDDILDSVVNQGIGGAEVVFSEKMIDAAKNNPDLQEATLVLPVGRHAKAHIHWSNKHQRATEKGHTEVRGAVTTRIALNTTETRASTYQALEDLAATILGS